MGMEGMEIQVVKAKEGGFFGKERGNVNMMKWSLGWVKYEGTQDEMEVWRVWKKDEMKVWRVWKDKKSIKKRRREKGGTMCHTWWLRIPSQSIWFSNSVSVWFGYVDNSYYRIMLV